MQTRSFYDILGIDRNASKAEILKAYKIKILKHHPDKNQGDEDNEAKLINEAKEVLSDPTKRAAYNLTLDKAMADTVDPHPSTFVSTGYRNNSIPLKSKSNYDLIDGYFIYFFQFLDPKLDKMRQEFRDEIIRRLLSDESHKMYKDLINYSNRFGKRVPGYDYIYSWYIHDTLSNYVHTKVINIYENIHYSLIKKSIQIAKELQEDFWEEVSKMDEETKANCMPDLISIREEGILQKGEITLNKANYPTKNHFLVDQINAVSKTIKVLKKPKEENENAVPYHRTRIFTALEFLTAKYTNSNITNAEMMEPTAVNPVSHFFKKLIQAITETLCGSAPFAMSYATKINCETPVAEAYKLHSKYSNRHYNFWKSSTRPNLNSTVLESKRTFGLNK